VPEDFRLCAAAGQVVHVAAQLCKATAPASLTYAPGGLDVRVDHRSPAAQGIDREPEPGIPRQVMYLERRTGRPCAAGDAIRAKYHERVAAREAGPAVYARGVARQRAEGRQALLEQRLQREGPPRKVPFGALTREGRTQCCGARPRQVCAAAQGPGGRGPAA
jgi:hypothetical protein